jgi:adenylate cyclase
VLLLAITLVAASAIGQRGLSTTRLGVSVIVLGVIGLAVGLLLITGLARSLAERIEALRIAAGAVGRGELEAEVTVDDGSELGLLQADFNRMVSGLRERERLRDLFGRQVGEDVVQHALERGVELGGEAREAAVLFIDLQGSTALAERRDPVEVVTLLNSFFAIVVEVVAAHSGWVNKFEGDAALCVFGAPLPDERAATNALATARELAARLTSELGELSAGIGVSAGRVVAGNVGAAKRFEYTVIGDPVNEAARLCDLAKTRAERVLASGAALQRAETEERERWRPGEEITLRGRSAATVVAVPRPV